MSQHKHQHQHHEGGARAAANPSATGPDTTGPDAADAAAATASPPQVVVDGLYTTVTLAQPLAAGEGSIAAITLREPDAGMLRGIKLLAVHELRPEAIITVAARCSQPHVSEAQLAGLKAPDLLRLTEAVTGFFAD